MILQRSTSQTWLVWVYVEYSVSLGTSSLDHASGLKQTNQTRPIIDNHWHAKIARVVIFVPVSLRKTLAQKSMHWYHTISYHSRDSTWQMDEGDNGRNNGGQNDDAANLQDSLVSPASLLNTMAHLRTITLESDLMVTSNAMVPLTFLSLRAITIVSWELLIRSRRMPIRPCLCLSDDMISYHTNKIQTQWQNHWVCVMSRTSFAGGGIHKDLIIILFNQRIDPV